MLKGPYQCYCMSLSFVNISHIGYINPTHSSQNSFLCEILCLFTFCPCSVNVTESIWKCVTVIVKDPVKQKSESDLVMCIDVFPAKNRPSDKNFVLSLDIDRHLEWPVGLNVLCSRPLPWLMSGQWTWWLKQHWVVHHDLIWDDVMNTDTMLSFLVFLGLPQLIQRRNDGYIGRN